LVGQSFRSTAAARHRLQAEARGTRAPIASRGLLWRRQLRRSNAICRCDGQSGYAYRYGYLLAQRIAYGGTTSCTAHVSAGTGTVSFTADPLNLVRERAGRRKRQCRSAGFSNWQAGTYTSKPPTAAIAITTEPAQHRSTITASAPVLSWQTPANHLCTPLSGIQLDATSGGIAALLHTLLRPGPSCWLERNLSVRLRRPIRATTRLNGDGHLVVNKAPSL